MRRLLIIPLLIIIGITVNTIIMLTDNILWIQGYFNMSITFILLLCLYLSIFIIIAIKIQKYTSRYKVILVLVTIAFISVHLMVYNTSVPSRSFNNESSNTILITDIGKLFSYETKFYKRENFFTGKMIAECSRGYGHTNEYQFDGDTLVIIEYRMEDPEGTITEIQLD